jgi:hypothetical protein
MERITEIYKFEVLRSNSYFVDTKGEGNRLVAEMTKDQERVFEFALSCELYEEFDGNINVVVNMKDRTIHMLNFKPSTLHESWRELAFRKKGTQITAEYHIRLVPTIYNATNSVIAASEEGS